MGWGNESLFRQSWSLDQDDRHAHFFFFLPPCPYMVKTSKNLLRNQKNVDLETWYAASGARALPSCSNDDPGLTLTYFKARSNLVPYAFVWEKGKTMDFSETIVVYDLKLATDDRSDKKFLLISKLCPLGLCAPYPGAIYMY